MGKDFSMEEFLMELSTGYQQFIHKHINMVIHNINLPIGH